MTDQNKDRYVNRRKMAWYSFYFILTVGTGLILFGLYSDSHASRIDAMSFLIGMVISMPVSIVLAYFGVTAIGDNAEMKTTDHK